MEICETNNLRTTNGLYRHQFIHEYMWTVDTRKLRAANYYFIFKIETSITTMDLRVEGGQNVDPTINYLYRGKSETNQKRPEISQVQWPKAKSIKYTRSETNQCKTYTDEDYTRKKQDLGFWNIDEVYEYIKTSMKQAETEELGYQEREWNKYKLKISEKSIKRNMQLYNEWHNRKDQKDLDEYWQETEKWKSE